MFHAEPLPELALTRSPGLCTGVPCFRPLWEHLTSSSSRKPSFPRAHSPGPPQARQIPPSVSPSAFSTDLSLTKLTQRAHTLRVASVLVTSGWAMPGLEWSRPLPMFVAFVANRTHQREPGQGRWRAGAPPALSCPELPGPAHTSFFGQSFLPRGQHCQCPGPGSHFTLQPPPELTSREFTSKGACTTQQVEFGRFLSSPVHLLNKCLENID